MFNSVKNINFRLIGVVLTVNLLGYMAGLSYSWSSPVLPKLHLTTADNPLGAPITAFEESWITSLISLGAVLGPFAGAYLVHLMGRKPTFILVSLPIITGYLILAFASMIELYFFARFFLGLGVGCVYSLIPAYVGEIAEDSNRGALGCCLGIMTSLGSLTSLTLGPHVSAQTFALVTLLPLGIFLLVFTLTGPESPYYLVAAGKKGDARLALSKIRIANLDKEMEYIKNYVEESRENRVPIKELLKSRVITKALFIGFGLMTFQQLSGIIVITSYLQPIFQATNTKIESETSSAIVGVVQFATNLSASLLVDRLGRKILLSTSLVGCFLAQLGLGIYFFLYDNGYSTAEYYWLPTVSVITYVICYNLGIGPVTWAMMGELFPSHFKAVATTSIAIYGLLMSFIISMIYPMVAEIEGVAPWYFAFSFCSALGVIFLIVFVPETKGKSFSQIQDVLEGHRK